MLRKSLFLVPAILITLTLPACDGPGSRGPTWGQVQAGVLEVVSNWHIEVLAGSKSDECDIAAASVAKRWAEEEYLKAIGSFVLKELSMEAVSKAVNALFPASWQMEVLRSQIIKWTYRTSADFLGKNQEFRSDRLTLAVSGMGRGGQANLSHLSGDPEFTDYLLVGYDRDGGRVSVLVIGDCGGEQTPRAWEASYEVDENGRQAKSGQTLSRVELDKVQAPSDSHQADVPDEGKRLISSVDITVYQDQWEYDMKTTTRTGVTVSVYDAFRSLVNTWETPVEQWATHHGGTSGGYIPAGEDGYVHFKVTDTEGRVEWWPSESEMYKIVRERIPDAEPSQPAVVDPSTLWKLQEPLYVITGHSTPPNGRWFWERAQELLGSRVGLFGGYARFEGIEKYIDNMRRYHTVLIIDASASADLGELRELAEGYPETFHQTDAYGTALTCRTATQFAQPVARRNRERRA